MATIQLSKYKRLFIGLFLAFIVATIIGTISHELGHYFVAKLFGYKAEINYAYTYWTPDNPDEIVPLDNVFFITLGGPMQSMLTGTMGLILLYIFRNLFDIMHRLTFGQWTIIFLSLFWLRPTANLFTWIVGYILTGQFSSNGDEVELAKYLQLPNWTILTLTAIIGIIVLTVIVFKFIPTKQRMTFLISGLTGGITGYFLWLMLLGKYIMP
ncbi:MAG TPA: hypothetical protein VNX01_10815 [Bacteroidia bacterium]|jgi:hypothetical protein|nr:hypothetical protein [Bacteroidia bacterium]